MEGYTFTSSNLPRSLIPPSPLFSNSSYFVKDSFPVKWKGKKKSPTKYGSFDEQGVEIRDMVGGRVHWF